VQDASQSSDAIALDPHERDPWLAEYRQRQYIANHALRTGASLDQPAREAMRARWLAQYGGTNRTCLLPCGGQ
jgi:hypothetical protein